MLGTAPASSQQALAVYAESLAAGRRVIVFGEPDTGVAERLTELGARTVVGVAPGEDPGDLRPATFDLALVPDLAAFGDPAVLLAVVRRVVGENGAALVAAPAGAIDYYELFDLVAGEFVDVRMIAQVPFHGVTLAELGSEDESPAVSVDTQLVGEAGAPEVFVALASQRGASLEPYAIVGLPPSEEPAVDVQALQAAGALLAQEQLRAAALEAEMDALRVQASQALERAAQLEREVAARARQLAELSGEVEEMRAAAEAGRIAASQVEDLARRADRAEHALAKVEPELARVGEGHAEELAQLEASLRDRAQAIRTLEEEVARRERMVHELVGALEERAAEPPAALAGVPSEPPDDAALRERLDALALDLARREGEAQAAAWTIAELERKLAAAASGAGPHRGTNEQQPELAAALDELDALRRAFAQEHEQRVRAEAALKKAVAGEGPRNTGETGSPGPRPPGVG
ncbi:MAG TPA: hypothetical protein VF765_00900 [Polyangiaceae bacterium]